MPLPLALLLGVLCLAVGAWCALTWARSMVGHPHYRHLPLRLMTNGDARVAGAAIATISGVMITHYAMPWLGPEVATGVGSAWAALWIIVLGTWLGGKAGPDITPAEAHAAGIRDGRAEAAREIRAQQTDIPLKDLADHLEGIAP